MTDTDSPISVNFDRTENHGIVKESGYLIDGQISHQNENLDDVFKVPAHLVNLRLSCIEFQLEQFNFFQKEIENCEIQGNEQPQSEPEPLTEAKSENYEIRENEQQQSEPVHLMEAKGGNYKIQESGQQKSEPTHLFEAKIENYEMQKSNQPESEPEHLMEAKVENSEIQENEQPQSEPEHLTEADSENYEIQKSDQEFKHLTKTEVQNVSSASDCVVNDPILTRIKNKTLSKDVSKDTIAVKDNLILKLKQSIKRFE